MYPSYGFPPSAIDVMNARPYPQGFVTIPLPEYNNLRSQEVELTTDNRTATEECKRLRRELLYAFATAVDASLASYPIPQNVQYRLNLFREDPAKFPAIIVSGGVADATEQRFVFHWTVNREARVGDPLTVQISQSSTSTSAIHDVYKATDYIAQKIIEKYGARKTTRTKKKKTK